VNEVSWKQTLYFSSNWAKEKNLEIKQARTNLARSPRGLSFYEEEKKTSNGGGQTTIKTNIIIDSPRTEFVLIWKGIDSKLAIK